MACVYTYKGKEYSEKEFKALLTEKLMGNEANTATVIDLFTPKVIKEDEELEPTAKELRKEAEKQLKEFEKTATSKEVIESSFDDLLSDLSPKAQITDTYPFRAMRGNVKKIVKALSKIAPNLSITVLGHKEYEKKAMESGMNERDAKNSAAFYDAATDSIVVNRLMAGANTLTHEAAHPIVAAAILARPELATAFASKLRNVQTPDGQTYGEWADRNYLAPYTQAEKDIEIVCEFLSNVAIGKHKNLVGQTIWNDIADFFKSILSSLGIELTQTLNTDADVMDFAKQFASALRVGAVLKAETEVKIADGQVMPQLTNTVSSKVVSKIGELIDKGMSMEDISEVLLSEKYAAIREVVEKEKGVTFDEFLEYVFMDFNTPITPETPNIHSGERAPSEKRLKAVIDALNNSTLSEDVKEKINSELGEFYNVLHDDEVIAMGNAIIEKLGGLEKALEYVESTNVLPVIKVYVYGQAINTYKLNQEKANTRADKEKWAEKQIEMADRLDNTLRDFGRGISYVRNIYYKSPLAVILQARKAVKKRNDLFAKNADKNAQKIVDVLNDPTATYEALGEVFNEENQVKTIEAQQEEIKRLEKELEKLKGKKTGTTISISKPKGKRVSFGVSKEDFKEALKLPVRLSANPFLDPVLYKKLGIIGAYGIQEGVRSFQDFYDWMRKNTGGQYQETYGDLYSNLRDKSVENGAEGFNTDEEVLETLTKIEALEREIEDKKRNAEISSKINKFGKFLSEQLPVVKDDKTRKQKIQELADDLDASLGTDSFSNAANEYFGISEEEAKEEKLERDIARFEKAFEEREQKPKVDNRTREEKLREEAARLDAEKGTNEYTKAVNDYFKEKLDQAKNDKLASDIAKFEKEFEERVNKPKTDTRTREERLKEEASRLDAEKNTTEFTEMVNDYFSKKLDQEKRSKLASDVAKLEKSLQERVKKPVTDNRTREQKLRDEAARLDQELGTTENTKLVDDYFVNKAKVAEQNKLISDVEKLEKQLQAKQPTNKTPVKREDRLRAAANELDAKIGGSTYIDAVENYLEEQDKKSKTSAFGRLLSQPIKDAQARKTKEENVREKAAELDALYNTNTFSKQAEAYLQGKQQEKALKPTEILKSINRAMIDAGYFKEKVIKGNTVKVVDWESVVKGSKTPDAAWAKVDAIIKATLSPSDYAIQEPLLRDMFFATVNDKKIKAVQATVNTIARKRGNFNRAKRKTRVEKLIEMYNTGALTKEDVRNELAEEIGLKQITLEDEQYIEAMLKAIDRSPMGAEREYLEEQLLYFLDKKDYMHLWKATVERMLARILTGGITILKNALGVFTALNMVTYKVLVNNLALVQGKGDKEIFRVIRKSTGQAAANFLDILWNGGVDLGSAFSETTETKEGTPRIRYIEHKKLNPRMTALGKAIYYPRLAGMNLEKVLSRLISAADSLNGSVLKEVGEYDYIKQQVKRNDPTLSNSEAAKRAYEIMYVKQIEEAEEQAIQEFKDREIELTDSKSDRFRFNRRVQEIVTQTREKEATKEGAYFANRYTFKAPDAGISGVLYFGLLQLKKTLPQAVNLAATKLEKTNPRAAEIAKSSAKVVNDIIFLQTLPFLKGITNILEKRLELIAPYGAVKSLAYVGKGLLSETQMQKDLAYRRAGEYAWRAAIGGLIAALLYSWADDDEESGKAITAQGTTDWRDNQVERTIRPSNSITINGYTIPFQATNTMDLNLILLGVYEDWKREQKRLTAVKAQDADNAVMTIGERVMVGILDDEYLRGMQSLYRSITTENTVQSSKYWNRTIAEFSTRAIVPATGFFRQGVDMVNSEAKNPIGLKEQLYKQSGIMSFMVDRKAFDYRGRSFDQADVYANSTRGFVKSMSKKDGADEIDLFQNKYKPSLSTPSVLSPNLTVVGNDGEGRTMTEEEYYDFSYAKAVKYGTLLEAYYKTNPEKRAPKDVNLPKVGTAAYDNLKKEATARLSLKGQELDLTVSSDRIKIQSEMIDILEESEIPKAIAKELTLLNSIATDAAFQEFCKTRGYDIPTRMWKIQEVYKDKLQEFKK